MKRVVLAVELKRLVYGGPVHRGLDVPHYSDAVLEADDGALIEAEEIAGLLAEAAALEIAVETVGQLKIGFPLREPECRRQVDDARRSPPLHRDAFSLSNEYRNRFTATHQFEHRHSEAVGKPARDRSNPCEENHCVSRKEAWVQAS